MTSTTPTMDILDQLHAALIRALREDQRDAFGSPVTVAEIYQDLVPYRLIRADLGFEMNADYEHTVLRLLAGERELAALEPKEARQELRQELDSPNPNVGLFRKFAGCDVHLRPGAHPEAAEAGVRAREAPAQAGPPESNAVDEQPDPWAEAPAPAEDPAAEEEALPAQPAAKPAVRAGGEGAVGGGRGTVATTPLSGLEEQGVDAALAGLEEPPEVAECAFCDEELPPRRTVRYCPFCGGDQKCMPCLACGETLDRGWRFCINCGAEARAPGE